MLVDFNPYSPMTDGLLFSWEELLGSDAAGDAAAAAICVSRDEPLWVEPSPTYKHTHAHCRGVQTPRH